MPTKPKINQPEMPNIIQGRDLFQTPNYAVDLLSPFIPIKVFRIWECAAGEGKISKRLEHCGYTVVSSDLRKCDFGISEFNFLTDTPRFPFRPQAIVTNPPFSLKQKFYRKCLEYNVPFALLIPADYCGWVIDAIRKEGCEKIIPTRRIDYITPTGKSGATGHTSYYHSMWLTHGFNLGQTETFIELTKEMKQNI